MCPYFGFSVLENLPHIFETGDIAGLGPLQIRSCIAVLSILLPCAASENNLQYLLL